MRIVQPTKLNTFKIFTYTKLFLNFNFNYFISSRLVSYYVLFWEIPKETSVFWMLVAMNLQLNILNYLKSQLAQIKLWGPSTWEKIQDIAKVLININISKIFPKKSNIYFILFYFSPHLPSSLIGSQRNRENFIIEWNSFT